MKSQEFRESSASTDMTELFTDDSEASADAGQPDVDPQIADVEPDGSIANPADPEVREIARRGWIEGGGNPESFDLWMNKLDGFLRATKTVRNDRHRSYWLSAGAVVKAND